MNFPRFHTVYSSKQQTALGILKLKYEAEGKKTFCYADM